MIAPLTLLAFAAVVATTGPRVLRKAVWPGRSPAWGIVAWQALTTSMVSAVVLAGAALAFPAVPFTTDLAAVLEACAAGLRAQYSTPGGAAVSATGAVLALTVLARVAYCLLAGLVAATRARCRQLQTLAVVAHRDTASGALVVDHPTAVAYCLPGRGREIVFTTAALAALDPDQVRAVVAHEKAHLRGRHDLVMAVATALERAFPKVSAFSQARAEMARLVEMLADDMAVHHADRLTMATALVHMAEGSAPAAALGAGGPTAVVRVRRLIRPADPLGVVRSVLVGIAAVTVMLVPVAVVTAPAVAATMADYCPITGPA